MMLHRSMRRIVTPFLLGWAFLVASALAQCKGHLNATVDAEAIAEAVANCETYEGSLFLSGDVDVSLDGLLKVLKGSITVKDNAEVQSATLRNITEGLSITGPGRPKISLPALEYIGPRLYLRETGQFSSMHFGANLTAWSVYVSQLKDKGARFDLGVHHTRVSYLIQGNPGLTTLYSPITTIGQIGAIQNNNNLQNTSLPHLRTVEEELVIGGNPNLEHINLGGLEYARQLSIKGNGREAKLNLSSLASIARKGSVDDSYFRDLFELHVPALRDVQGDGFLFKENIMTELNLDAVEVLNATCTVAENNLLNYISITRARTIYRLVATNNPRLNDISIPRTTAVTTEIYVEDNPQLLNVTANLLERARGITLIGNFTNVEFFSLKEVTGDFDLVGDPSMDCSWFDENFVSKVVKGSYRCVGNHTKPNTPRHPSTPTTLEELDNLLPDDTHNNNNNNSDGDNTVIETAGGLSREAKTGIGVGVAVAGISLASLGAWLFIMKKKRGGEYRDEAEAGSSLDTGGPSELQGSTQDRHYGNGGDAEQNDDVGREGTSSPLAESGEERKELDIGVGTMVAHGASGGDVPCTSPNTVELPVSEDWRKSELSAERHARIAELAG